MIAHLRDVKDPLLAARATRLLPSESRVRVIHAGSALQPELADAASAESGVNPRYRWVGPLARRDALRLIARSRALLVTSRAEGGANVVSEAVANDTPVLSTRIDGTVGLLGADYPGLFSVGDARALAGLLTRLETDASFAVALERACASRKPLFEPAHERRAWDALLAEIAGPWHDEHG